jgi:hypothetical protein
MTPLASSHSSSTESFLSRRTAQAQVFAAVAVNLSSTHTEERVHQLFYKSWQVPLEIRNWLRESMFRSN